MSHGIATPARADSTPTQSGNITHASLGPAVDLAETGCIQTASVSTYRGGGNVPDTYWPLSVFAANADNLHSAADQARVGQRIQFILAANGSALTSMIEHNFSLIRSHHTTSNDLSTPDEGGCAPL